jgi:hypothetical protein
VGAVILFLVGGLAVVLSGDDDASDTAAGPPTSAMRPDLPTESRGRSLPAAEDVIAAGVEEPVQVAEVPEGWGLTDAELVPATTASGEECTTLELTYSDIETLRPPEVQIDVRSDDCVPVDSPAADGEAEAIVVGDWSGEVTVSNGRCTGTLSNGDTTIDIDADLDLESTHRVLESLEPYDPAVPPTQIDAR